MAPRRRPGWNSVYRRFRRWAESGHWQAIFEALQDPDLDWAMVDSTARRTATVRAHQQAADIPCWAKKSAATAEALGRSRGGLTTKIHAVVDALGNPLRVHLTPGQWADSPQALALLDGLEMQAVVADKAYDTNAIVEGLTHQGVEVVIPPKTNRLDQRTYDKNLYADRNKIERFFNQLKINRRVATRYDKTATSFLAFVHLACALIWLR